MLNNIKLAIRDIWRDKLFVFLTILLLSSLSYIIISSRYSLLEDLKRSRDFSNMDNLTQFKVDITSYDTNVNSDFKNSINKIYERNTVTFIQSYELSEIYNERVYLILGQPELFYSSFKTNSIKVYTNIPKQNAPANIKIDDIDYPITMMENPNDPKFYFNQVDGQANLGSIYIIASGEQAQSFLTDIKNNELRELFENTWILSNDNERIDDFVNITNSSYVYTRILNKNNSQEEINFIRLYIYPTLFLMILASGISLLIILKGIIEVRTREFSIHIFHGATILQVFIRFFVYFTFIVTSSFVLLAYLGLIKNHEWLNYFILLLGFLSTVLSLIFYLVKKSDINEVIRGDLS